MGSIEVYAALKAELPNVSDVVIGREIGLCHSAISKLRLGYGIGLKAALWLSERDTAYKPLYKEALETEKASRSRREAKRKATRKYNDSKMRGVDLSALPPHIQQFCGFVG